MRMRMSCNHPFKAFWTGCYTDTGKKDYVIMPSTSGDLLSIDYLEKKGIHYNPGTHFKEIDGRIFISDPVAIPCGSCVGCRMMSARDWKIRLCKEAEAYPDQVWFVTLTYDDAHLPFDENGEVVLVKKHVQDFMKNLRGHGSIRKYRYFAVGEYGSQTQRPHYHLIIFGDLGDLNPVAFRVYESPLVYKCWQYGKHDIVPAEPGCMAYVAGYMEKKQTDEYWNSHSVRPFRLMSRKPMIGYKALGSIAYPDVAVYGNFGKFHKAQAPKAYTKKLEEEDWYDSWKSEMEDKAKKSLSVKSFTFGTSDQDLAGFSADRKCNESLKKVRNTKL